METMRTNLIPPKTGFLLRIFSEGGGAKSIVMQISTVMLLFLDQISGRGKSFQGGTPVPPVEESQQNSYYTRRIYF